MRELALPLGTRPLEDIEWLLVTTSRAAPLPLADHVAADPRGPFHLWMYDTVGLVEARGPREVVVPDGVTDNPLAVRVACRALILCVAGAYHSSRAMQLGGELPEATATLLEASLRNLAADYHLSLPACLITMEDLGAPVYTGDSVLEVVRKLRASPRYHRPANAFLVGEAIRDNTRPRKMLAALGYDVHPEHTGPWRVEDQAALLAFQRYTNLEPTGCLDDLTVAALREAEFYRTAGSGASPTHAAPAHAQNRL